MTNIRGENAVLAAGQKYGVPAWVMIGVYGLETSFGQNITTSSAGATGAFQFIPSTAASYNYPLTNSPSQSQFAQQADAAAHYLSDLFHQTGSWDTALHHYSGGGYGEGKVRQEAASAGTTLLGNAGVGPVDPSGVNVPGISNPLDAVAKALTDVFNTAVSDLKYGAVLIVVLAAAGFMMVHGIRGTLQGRGAKP